MQQAEKRCQHYFPGLSPSQAQLKLQTRTMPPYDHTMHVVAHEPMRLHVHT